MLTKIITQYGYDIDGRIIKNTDGNGNLITGTWGGASGDLDGLDGLLKSVQYPTYREDYKFDNRNRKTQVSRILNATTRYTSSSEYDARGNVITQIDALNRKTRIDYDALSRPIKTTDALNGITQLAYDTRDNLISITDANGNTTRYEYDKANRLLKETKPLGQATLYNYDGNGNLTTRTLSLIHI